MPINLLKAVIPHFIAILMVLTNLTDIKSLLLLKIIPAFDIMIIYYFRICKASLFSLSFLFLLGLWADALSGLPLGITSFCYIIVAKFFNILNKRMVTVENFPQIWGQFSCFLFFILTLKWLFLSAYNLAFYDPLLLLRQLIISSFIYPVMHQFFDYLNYKVAGNK